MFTASQKSTAEGYIRTAALLTFALALNSASLLAANELSTYRGLRFGVSLQAASKQAGVRPTDARTIYQRPALIQELDWQPRTPVAANAKVDPVREGVLSFLDGELYRIVVTYDRYQIEGMTADDMIEAISSSFGSPTKPNVEIVYRTIYSDTVPVIARWEDDQYCSNLVRTGDRASYALIAYSKALDRKAQNVIAEAIRLDAQEAPQREEAKSKKRDDDERMLLQKAREVNKPNFRP
jgi:hypothetical protein